MVQVVPRLFLLYQEGCEKGGWKGKIKAASLAKYKELLLFAKLCVVTIFVCSRDKNMRQRRIMHTLFYKYVTSPRLDKPSCNIVMKFKKFADDYKFENGITYLPIYVIMLL